MGTSAFREGMVIMSSNHYLDGKVWSRSTGITFEVQRGSEVQREQLRWWDALGFGA